MFRNMFKSKEPLSSLSPWEASYFDHDQLRKAVEFLVTVFNNEFHTFEYRHKMRLACIIMDYRMERFSYDTTIERITYKPATFDRWISNNVAMILINALSKERELENEDAQERNTTSCI